MKNCTLSATFRPFARRMKFRNVLPLLAFALSACEQTPAVGVDVEPAFSRGRGPVVESVTGFGLFTQGGEPTTFSFTARRYADGSVEGEWERQNRSSDLRGHGDVTCFTISGNRAWIGGIIEQFSPSDPPRVGLEVVWRVVDNGQGANGPPDEISRSRDPAKWGGHRHWTSAADLATYSRAPSKLETSACEADTPGEARALLASVNTSPSEGGHPHRSEVAAFSFRRRETFVSCCMSRRPVTRSSFSRPILHRCVHVAVHVHVDVPVEAKAVGRRLAWFACGHHLSHAAESQIR